MFYAIYYVLRTGIHRVAGRWKALPRCLGTASTVHDRFQQWVRAGVFYTLWHHDILELEIEGRLDWEFQSIDGCQTKAPLGGQVVSYNVMAVFPVKDIIFIEPKALFIHQNFPYNPYQSFMSYSLKVYYKFDFYK
jgi:transposase